MLIFRVFSLNRVLSNIDSTSFTKKSSTVRSLIVLYILRKGNEIINEIQDLRDELNEGELQLNVQLDFLLMYLFKNPFYMFQLGIYILFFWSVPT